MKKVKIRSCPFCGANIKKPVFCSTRLGPALICPGCDADGPPAYREEFDTFRQGSEDLKKHQNAAIAQWNGRAPEEEKTPENRGRRGVFFGGPLLPLERTSRRDRRRRRRGELPGFLAASVLSNEKRHGEGRRVKD